MDAIGSFFRHLFDTSSFPPRWSCGKWSDFHGWLYILSDISIFLAYYAIPLILLYYLIKIKSVPFRPVFFLFVAFIFLCGATHLIEAIIFWYPHYRISALAKLLTAVVSWITVFALVKNLPRALKAKTPKELQKTIDEKTKELQLINESLEKSERQFKALVNENPDIILRFNKEYKIDFANKSAKELSQLIKKHSDKSTIQEHFKLLRNKVEEVFNEKKETHSYHDELLIGEKIKKYLSISLIPVKSFDGLSNKVIAVGRDITSEIEYEKLLENRVKELQALSGKMVNKLDKLNSFARIVSHNLRSPVGNLDALCSLYKESSDKEEKNIILEKVEKVISNLQNTISDLTEIVKINESEDRIPKENLILEKILNNVLVSLVAEIEEAKAKINCDFSEVPQIMYPRAYLESIFLNLITNSIKYRSLKRNLNVELKSIRDRGYIVLTCQDNGVGIDLKKYGDKVFGLNQTFHTNNDARGVGLFITKNQIESMGGSITVESEPDVGTKFIIKFLDLKEKDIEEQSSDKSEK